MVFQIAGAVILPIIMLIVAASPFDEPIQIQPSEPTPVDDIGLDVFVFFILWAIWILILTRILYHVGKRRFRVQN
ncbi:MAG: hypothetical protein GTN35_04780 [Nitrososphaeria archaeon]|nr:hypothetical protein [Nitrosopumilaceae archaeon]NIP09165.1 hypothetical protein [Nitrosopumilaceae archaeon]NIP91693.1 hypothetical protein [Nitrososphaeria archaeon]NIS95533.1 hypothetical protein [Nitrosopumilaceae archaeon]